MLNRLKVDMIRKNTTCGYSWLDKLYNMPERTVTSYYIRYRNMTYHNVIEIYKTVNNKWKCVTKDGTIYEADTLKCIYDMRKQIAYNDYNFIREIFAL